MVLRNTRFDATKATSHRKATQAMVCLLTSSGRCRMYVHGVEKHRVVRHSSAHRGGRRRLRRCGAAAPSATLFARLPRLLGSPACSVPPIYARLPPPACSLPHSLALVRSFARLPSSRLSSAPIPSARLPRLLSSPVCSAPPICSASPSARLPSGRLVLVVEVEQAAPVACEGRMCSHQLVWVGRGWLLRCVPVWLMCGQRVQRVC